MAEKTTTPAKTLDLVSWLSQMNLTDAEFVEQFQQIALTGNYDLVRKLMPFFPEDAYYADGGARARAVLDARHEDVFMLLRDCDAYRRLNRRHRVLDVSIVLTFFAVVAGIYGILYGPR